MTKTTSGFTIIELLVVIAVIGVLATIGITSFGRYQTSTTDSQRSSKAIVLSEAFEKYYDKNGEYPGCTNVTGAGSVVTATVLPGIDALALLTPKSAAGDTNSIKCLNLTGAAGEADIFAYVGNSDTTCTTGSACIQFTLKYKEEATGTIKSITSRRGPAVLPPPVTGTVADNFNRTAATLGVTSTGALPWTALSGTWSTNGTNASTTTADSSNPLATVNFGSADVDASIDVSSGGGGDSLIVRASNATNYIRARYYHHYTSSTGAGSCAAGTAGGQYYGGPSESNSPNTYIYSYGTPGCGSPYWTRQTYVSGTPDSSAPAYYNCPCYMYYVTDRPVIYTPGGTTYTYYYYVYLEKVVAGVSTTLYTGTLGSSVSNLRITTKGSTINLYVNGSATASTTLTETFNQTAVNHGIGRGPTGNYTASAIDNLNLIPN